MSPAFVEGKWNVSKFNYRDEVLKSMKPPKKVVFCDVTMREGEDATGVIFTTKDKVRLSQKLDEVGMPIIQPTSLKPQIVNKAIEELKAVTSLRLNSKISVLGGYLGGGGHWGYTGSSLDEIDKAADCDADWIELLDQKQPDLGVKCVEHAKKRGIKIRCDINTASMKDLEYIRSYFKAVAQAGADELYCSEHGQMSPNATKWFVSEIKKVAPKTPLTFHIHNLLGNSVAIACAAVEAGVEVLDVTVNGLGGFMGGGNLPLEEVAVILPVWYGIETGIKLEKLMELCTLVEDLTKIPIRDNKPLVGKLAFAAGISLVTDGYYSGISPSLVGQRGTIIFGKYASPELVKAKIKELGLKEVPDRLMQKVLDRIVDELEARKRVLTDDEFKAILREVK